jgi:malonyl CoA-acyl carrier protein transacylase/phosphopantetheinyl transferase
MIAHLIPASGIAGLIKTALALYHKMLPPTLNCEEPDPALELEKTPFYINTETRPWIHGAPATPRRAGVNAFGFGGINAHAILEECRTGREFPEGTYCPEWETELLVLSGESRAELLERGRRLQVYLASAMKAALRDLASTLNAQIADSTCRLSIVAASIPDLERKLSHAVKKLEDPACPRIREKSGIYYFAEPLAFQGKLAFLFPGEGSQYVNMFADLCLHLPECRHCFDVLDRAFADRVDGLLPSSVIFPPPLVGEEEQRLQRERIWGMEGGVDGVIMADRAMFRILQNLCIAPDAIVGHSSGEFMSLEAAGVLDYHDENELIDAIRSGNSVIRKITASERIPRIELHAVGGVDPETASRILASTKGQGFLAMDNCPNQMVVCGRQEAEKEMLRQFLAARGICQRLPFARPYHSPLFGPALEYLEAYFNTLDIAPPKVPLYSCMTAAAMPQDPAEIRRLAVGQWVARVRFRETVEAMYADGVRIFLEVGPRANLTGFVSDTLSGRPSVSVATNVHQRSGITQLHHALGLLAAHGVSMNLAYLYKHRDPKRIDFSGGPGADDRGARKVAPLLPLSLPMLGIRAKGMASPACKSDPGGRLIPPPSREDVPQGAQAETHAEKDRSPQIAPRSAHGDAAACVSGNPQTGAMQAYLHTMSRFLDFQQEVLEAYLSPPAERHTSRESSAKEIPGGDAACAQSASPPISGHCPMPFVDTVISHRTGEEVIASREFDLEEDLFLLDHTLGRDLSVTDKALTGLPLMPLTVSMEILSEAAALLMPSDTLIGMRDIRAHRWLAFDDKRLRIAMRARRLAADEVHVQFWEAGERGSDGTPPPIPAVEGIMVFGRGYPDPPPVGSFALKSRRLSRWTSDALYAEGMFSGPSFQGMASVDAWGEDGAEATLRALPTEGFFRSRAAPRFVTDHILMDAAGQLIAYWIADHRETGFNVYPFRVGQVHFYGPPLRPGERARCQARIAPLAENQLRSTIDIIGPAGRLHMRLADWDDRSFDLPASFYRIRFRPAQERLSTAWPEPVAALPADGSLQCFVMRDFPDRLLHAHGMVWLRVLAHLALSRREREVWRTMPGSPERRIEWLLARIAAKDAARAVLATRYGLALCLPDVEIGADRHGRPLIQGTWTGQVANLPGLSLSHKKGIGAALVSERGEGCGIDLEILDAGAVETARGALQAEEQACFGPSQSSSDGEWPLRVWCAKEAVGKALGRGLQGRPENLILREADTSTGRVTLQAAGGLLREFPLLEGQLLQAHTLREGALIAASAVLRTSHRESFEPDRKREDAQ